MEIAIFAAIGFNILASAFAAGKLYQRVGDLVNHIQSLERKLENTDAHIDGLAERLARLEGRMGK